MRLLAIAVLLCVGACGSKTSLFSNDPNEDSPAPAPTHARPNLDAASACGVDGATCRGTATCCANVCDEGICGAPPPACKPGEGAVKLVDSSENGSQVAIDRGYAYFISYPSRQLRRVPKLGGKEELVASGVDGSFSLAVDASHVYWTDIEGRRVRRVAKTGGTPETVVSTDGPPRGLALSSSNIYVGVGAAKEEGFILRVPKAGGAATRVPSPSGAPMQIATVDDNLAWSTGTGRSVHALAVDEAEVRTLHHASSYLPGLAMTGELVFFNGHSGGSATPARLFRAPFASGPTTSIESGQAYPWFMATNGKTVVSTDRQARKVVMVPIAGSPVKSASLPAIASGVAIDAHCIYVAVDAPGGPLLRLPID
jgi:hypothetical protein